MAGKVTSLTIPQSDEYLVAIYVLRKLAKPNWIVNVGELALKLGFNRQSDRQHQGCVLSYEDDWWTFHFQRIPMISPHSTGIELMLHHTPVDEFMSNPELWNWLNYYSVDNWMDNWEWDSEKLSKLQQMKRWRMYARY